MICRLVIIIIVIVNSPNDFITYYFLIIACVVMALLVHQVSKPYASNYLHLFDRAVLQQKILVSFLPLVEFFASYNFNSNLVTGAMYVLVLLPLVSLFTMKVLMHRENIRNMIVYCSTLKCKNSRDTDQIPLNDCKTQLLKEIIVDDSMRRNATIVDV